RRHLMKVNTSRFGKLDVEEESLIRLNSGMVGFPHDLEFAWVPHPTSPAIAWLQSIQNPALAFPLYNGALVDPSYPDLEIEKIAEQAGIQFQDREELALMVVISAGSDRAPLLNLMAPVLINAQSREGAQVVLTHSKFSTITLEAPEQELERGTA
ncbi:MAG: flagellar assembly protein FliW, partial [Polyangiaceae bacterium]|nr:flagellar assembly protein FliW [Polyangiaceae bacterium]